jgi:cytidylate kinase
MDAGDVLASIGEAGSFSPIVEVRMFRLDQPIIVTIDGPAGTGKSTVAHLLARRLGLHVLNTGAMYRAAAAIAMDHDVPIEHVKRLLEVVRASNMGFDWKADPPEITAYAKSFARRVGEPDVTSAVGKYADIRELRELMVGMQRKIAHDHPRLVTEGRDQGSIVFPEAQAKFYLEASSLVRAKRRQAQLLENLGHVADVDQLRREIEDRDARDKARPFGALVCPPDAEVLDTSAMSLDEVVERLHDRVVALSKARG